MELTKTTSVTNNRKNQIIYVLTGFLLGISSLAKGVMPFGCALLCAMPKKGRKEVFFGVLAASFFDVCIPLAVFCSIYLFLVLNAREKQGGVFMFVRILLSFSISALRSSYIALVGVEDIMGVFRLLAAVIAYPAFTYAFCGFFDKKKELYPKKYDLSLLAFAFSFTCLFSQIQIDGISLSIIPATLFTLYMARSKGFAFGGICGVLCGFISGGSATGALGVLGMTYGLLANEIEPLALLLSFMLSISGYFYLSGASGTILAGLMITIAYSIFIPFRSRIEIYRQKNSNSEKRMHDRRLARYAAAFSSLSGLFYTVSSCAKEESITDLNGNIVKCVDDFCNRCQGCELERTELSNFFTSEYRRCGVIAYSRIPLHISSRCSNACAMARDINNLSVVKTANGEKGLKQMAEEYSAFSTILIDASKKQEDSHRSDNFLAEQIKSALLEIGVFCDGVRVVGTRLRSITVFGVTPEKIKCSPSEISKAVGRVLHTKISTPELVMHDDYILMKLKTIPAFRVECAKISEAKTGETVCGDTVSFFENDERYFYCLVSDGMGSGRDAALTSKLSAIMLEKLLTVRAEKESALKLLNKALVEKSEEIFATIDLLEIDRVNSTATIIKAGAAPTLLIRKGKITILEAKTPPAGIMKKIVAEKKSFHIEKGDMIVMLSDGVLQTGNQFDLIPTDGLPHLPNARALASKIMRSACTNKEYSDDMSVCAMRIY